MTMSQLSLQVVLKSENKERTRVGVGYSRIHVARASSKSVYTPSIIVQIFTVLASSCIKYSLVKPITKEVSKKFYSRNLPETVCRYGNRVSR